MRYLLLAALALGGVARGDECFDYGNGFAVIDRVPIGTDLSGCALDFQGNLACIACIDGTVIFLDATDPRGLPVIQQTFVDGRPIDVAVQPNGAFVALSDSTVALVQINGDSVDRSIPIRIPDTIVSLAHMVTALFVATADSGIYVFDEADPSLPLITRLGPLGGLRSFDVFGDLGVACLVDLWRSAGIAVFSTSDPRDGLGILDPLPFSLSEIDGAYVASRHGNTLTVAAFGGAGVQLAQFCQIDTEDLHAPRVLAMGPSVGGAASLYTIAAEINGYGVGIVRPNGGIIVLFDIADPLNPSIPQLCKSFLIKPPVPAPA